MKLFIFFVGLVLIFCGCVKNNPDPSWIEVSNWTLQSNPDAQSFPGILTSNITYACVYLDGNPMGFFELPFKIPFLKTGSSHIQIFPVVKNNGISSTKMIYPFLEPYDVYADLESNKTLSISPTTRYYSNVKFWKEDFEDASVKIDTDPNSLTQLYAGSDPTILKYGNYYGHISLDKVDSTWVAYTKGLLNLPKGGKEVYLEVDYYNTNTVTTGVLAVLPGGDARPNPNIQLNRQDPSTIQWKKIYIDLKELVSYYTTAEYYEITFQALLDEGYTTGDIYLDNIKVVYF